MLDGKGGLDSANYAQPSVNNSTPGDAKWRKDGTMRRSRDGSVTNPVPAGKKGIKTKFGVEDWGDRFS